MVKYGLYNALKVRLLENADPNLSCDGVSVLHFAVTYQQNAMAALLAQYGADIHKKDKFFNESPLEIAMSLKNYQLVEIFNSIKLH